MMIFFNFIRCTSRNNFSENLCVNETDANQNTENNSYEEIDVSEIKDNQIDIYKDNLDDLDTCYEVIGDDEHIYTEILDTSSDSLLKNDSAVEAPVCLVTRCVSRQKITVPTPNEYQEPVSNIPQIETYSQVNVRRKIKKNKPQNEELSELRRNCDATKDFSRNGTKFNELLSSEYIELDDFQQLSILPLSENIPDLSYASIDISDIQDMNNFFSPKIPVLDPNLFSSKFTSNKLQQHSKSPSDESYDEIEPYNIYDITQNQYEEISPYEHMSDHSASKGSPKTTPDSNNTVTSSKQPSKTKLAKIIKNFIFFISKLREMPAFSSIFSHFPAKNLVDYFSEKINNVNMTDEELEFKHMLWYIEFPFCEVSENVDRSFIEKLNNLMHGKSVDNSLDQRIVYGKFIQCTEQYERMTSIHKKMHEMLDSLIRDFADQLQANNSFLGNRKNSFLCKMLHLMSRKKPINALEGIFHFLCLIRFQQFFEYKFEELNKEINQIIDLPNIITKEKLDLIFVSILEVIPMFDKKIIYFSNLVEEARYLLLYH